ncbi:hypothetical protein QTP70_012394 [Hemibagrus guttatus]|uniref:ribonuclease H n=1 Tax=Hemibagrus guttatus TaxID=175788 RepID=A0AAE0UTS6_9TELE|nr:hypothetical protein QTP70_012394 [Hemibagrus guttatus]
MEKYRDGQRELHCVFVDLEKAYDRVSREELWYCMRKSGVAEKYVRVVQDMYERSRTVVRCAVGQTEEFNVEVGLHQGSALSPFLFAIVMDQLSEEVRQESPWTMMFADDIVICSESREQVEENLERWRFALERRGMKLSENVINRMREPSKPSFRSSPPPEPAAPAPTKPTPPPSSAPAAKAVDPASLLAPPPFDRPLPLASPFPDPVPSSALLHKPSPPPCVEITAPCATPADPGTPLADPATTPTEPAAAAAASSSPLLPPPALEEPVTPPTAVEESELRRKITEEVQKGLEEERSKTQYELHQWVATANHLSPPIPIFCILNTCTH